MRQRRIRLAVVTAIFAFLTAVMLPSPTTAYAATSAGAMLKEARATQTYHRYVIVSSYSAHQTRVYDTKRGFACVQVFPSCGAADGHRGRYKLNHGKRRVVNGSRKSKGKSVYHEYYVFNYDSTGSGTGGNGIHSVLYKGDKNTTSKVLYNNTKSQIQDASNPMKYHWSGGCTRLYLADARWIYNNCLPGTGYSIMK